MLGISIGSQNTTVSFRNENEENAFLQLSDTSKRVCPSIFSYTEKYRTMGDIAESTLKKNILTSFQYLNRLIGIDKNTNFGENELDKYYFIGDDMNENNFINIKFEGKKVQIEYKNVIVGFLNFIKRIYLGERNLKEQISIFSYPDFYNLTQINLFKDIISTVGFKDIYLISESMAITLYYGYNKYHDFFINNKIVNYSINKYIIFIDIGHSKTTFILSKFNAKIFTVLKVESIPFLGGRDFDYNLYEFCCDEFEKKQGINIKEKGLEGKKYKLKIIPEVSKLRKKLTVNKNVNIIIDCLADNKDLNFTLTKEKYEKINETLIQKFKKRLTKFYNECVTLLKGTEVNSIEMAGDFLRTPALENIVKEVTNIKLSKGIIIDECISIGCVYYGCLLKNNFKFKGLKSVFGINNYPIKYSINFDNEKNFIIEKNNIPCIKIIEIELIDGKNIIHLFTKNENDNDYENLFDIIINLKKENFSKLIFEFLIDYNGMISINEIYGVNINSIEKIKEIKSIIEYKYYNNFYFSNNEKSLNNINEMKNIESLWNDDDRKHLTYLKNKNLIQYDLIEIKNIINKNKLQDKKIDNKPILDFIKDLDKNLNKNDKNTIEDLELFKGYVEEIINSISEKDLDKIKIQFNNYIKDDIDKCNDLLIKDEEEKAKKIMSIIDEFTPKIKFTITKQEIVELMNDYMSKIKQYNI